MLFDRWRRSKRAVTLPRPVISIGNLTLGGTGKTPLLIFLADELKRQERRPVILSRGYGQDEITLLKEKCPGVPIAAGADRVKSAFALSASEDVGVFLLDDGFQHWPIQRSLDVVCVDASMPVEEERLFPEGRLREPWSALSRARVAVITRADSVSEKRLAVIREYVRARMPEGRVVLARFAKTLTQAGSGAVVAWQDVRGKKVVALSAIGNPAAFEAGLEKEGALVTPLRFRDHHAYEEKELSRIVTLAKELNAPIITTEKDWVKFRVWSPEMLVVRIEIAFSREDEALLRDAVLRGIS